MTRDEWLALGGKQHPICSYGTTLVTEEEFLNVAHRLFDGTYLQLQDAWTTVPGTGHVVFNLDTGSGTKDMAAAILLEEQWPREITPVGYLIEARPFWAMAAAPS